MTAFVRTALLAVVIAACGAEPGTGFTTTLAPTTGEFPLRVTLGDQTGLVTGLGPAEVDTVRFRDAGIFADPRDPNTFVLTWLGGMCDNDVALGFRATDAGYDLRIAIHEKLGLGCPAAGILRAVRITTSEAVDLEKVTVSGSKSLQFIVEQDCGPLERQGTSDAKVACFAILEATVGPDASGYARVTVAPAGGACPGDECATAQGIAGQAWRVDATTRDGQDHAWRCTYRPEKATCQPVSQPASQ